MGKKSKKRKQAVHVASESKPFLIPIWKNHPTWVALFVIGILLIVFYWPVLFGGNTFLPPDSLASKSVQPFADDALDRGVYPLWNPYIFGGMPSFASLTKTPFVDIVSFILIKISWILSFGQKLPFFRLFLDYFLLGAGMFLLLRSKKLDPEPALFASLVFLFLPQVVAYTAFGHNTKLGVVMLMPIIFLLADRLLEKRNLLFFSLTGLAVGLQLLRNHIQMSFYVFLMIGLYAIYWFMITVFRDKHFRKALSGVGILACAILLGSLISSVINLSVWEYAQHSIRGGESGGLDFGYATNWSFPPQEILALFNPFFMGFGGDTYWGPMPHTDFPIYFGLVPLLFAGLAIVFRRDRNTVFFVILAGIVLLISFGKHFPVLYGPMFKLVPMFNKFRAPKMILFLFGFSTAILSAYGLQGMIDWQKSQNLEKLKTVKRYLMIFGGTLLLLFLILLMGKSLYYNWASRIGDMRTLAYDKALISGLKAILIFGISSAIVFTSLKRTRIPRTIVIFFIGLLLLDLWSVDKRFMDPRPESNMAAYFRATDDVKFLKSREGHFRILPVQDQRSPNWYMYHLIPNVWGYQAAKLRTYQDLAVAFNMPNGFLQKYLKVVDGRYVWKNPSEIDPAAMHRDRTFLRLMNVQYVLCPYQLPDASLSPVVQPERPGRNFVMAFDDYLPRVYFPEYVVRLQGKENILGFMSGKDFDPEVTAVVEKDLPGEHLYSGDNHAEITAYDIHQIEISADVKTPSLMVVSEIYYPAGWKATVDGKETEILKTDYTLRSIYLEPGKHRITFEFKPRMLRIGLLISISVFTLMIGGVILGWTIEKRKKQLAVQTS